MTTAASSSAILWKSIAGLWLTTAMAIKPSGPTEFGWPVWRFQGDQRFVFAQQNSIEQQAQYSVQAYQLGQTVGLGGHYVLVEPRLQPYRRQHRAG